MRRAPVTLVVGTRPEAIKLQPVAAALSARGIRPSLLLTGQHPIVPARFGLAGFDVATIDCPGVPDPLLHVSHVAKAARQHISGCELAVVQGDTSSALGAALAAAEAGIAVAHVEAGLRTHDPTAPWPEEEFRVAIDALADLLFAPTELSAANLRRERVHGTVEVTGNTAVDAVLDKLPALPPPPARNGAPRLLVTCHRRESWGERLTAIAAAVREIAAPTRASVSLVLHPNPRVAFEMRRLLDGSTVELLPPCGHLEMLQAMRAADLVLSDSGGMQEEAPALGVPLLVLRERTERPEAVASGNIALVGTDAKRIVSAVERLLGDDVALEAMRRPALPYGDGRAGKRIAASIERWLCSKDFTGGVTTSERQERRARLA